MTARKSFRKIAKDQFLAEARRRELDREKSIIDLIEQLHAYEKKYHMRSEFFFKLFVGTPLIKQDDFPDWAMCYRQYFKIVQSQLSIE
jgi:hypothetical protein